MSSSFAMPNRLRFCILFSVFCLMLLVSDSTQDNVNEGIISDFNSGKRTFLGIGLTPKRLIVLFGAAGGIDRDNLTVYEMPPFAFSPGAQHVVALSNGGPISKKWPAFYKAIKSKSSSSSMITLYDSQHEYFLAIFDSTTSVLYNLDTDKVEIGFNAGRMQAVSNSAAILLSSSQPKTFYSYKETKLQKAPNAVYNLNRWQFSENSIANSSAKIVENKNNSLCARYDPNGQWIFDNGCNSKGGNKTAWTFSGGFTNGTHFHLIGKQVIVFQKFSESDKHSSRPITLQKLDDFFGHDEDSGRSGQISLFEKHDTIVVGVIIGLVVLFLVLCVCCLAFVYFKKMQKKHHHHLDLVTLKVTNSNQHNNNHSHSHGHAAGSHLKASHSHGVPTLLKASHSHGRGRSHSRSRSHQKKRSSSRFHGSHRTKHHSQSIRHDKSKHHSERHDHSYSKHLKPSTSKHRSKRHGRSKSAAHGNHSKSKKHSKRHRRFKSEHSSSKSLASKHRTRAHHRSKSAHKSASHSISNYSKQHRSKSASSKSHHRSISKAQPTLVQLPAENTQPTMYQTIKVVNRMDSKTAIHRPVE